MRNKRQASGWAKRDRASREAMELLRFRPKQYEPDEIQEWRQHHRADGTPKQAFVSRAAAKDHVKRIRIRAAIYRCDVCTFWHFAHKRRSAA